MAKRNRQRNKSGIFQRVTDGFQNFAARVGIGTDNPATGPLSINYGKTGNLTRRKNTLNAMFRESWIVNKAVVVIPDDMTKRGIELEGSWDADKMKLFRRMFIRLKIWDTLQSALVWSRLYGGSAALLMIDGHDLKTPLAVDSITQDQFKGLRVYDRWCLMPDLNTEITDYGPDYGMPEYYTVNNGGHDQGQRIHHSRLLIFTGLELPYEDAQSEEGWGASMVETMFDRLVAFDSTTQGAAQLTYRAYLRTIKVKDLRNILAEGGRAEEALMRQFDFIRRMQVNEGITLLDAEDEFQAAQYTFAGLDQLLLAFGQQLSGATGIPLVRLFGQSPVGLNATGDSDLATYYDTIKATQEIDMRFPIQKICDVMSRSVFGEPLPEDFWFEFAPLWELKDSEKADIAAKDTSIVVSAYDAGLVSRATALRELQAGGAVTGRWTKIQDDEVDEAEGDPPAGELTSEEEALTTDEYDPNQPRDPDGKFGSKGGETTTEEKQKKIDSVKIDFDRDNTLPGLNKEDLETLGKEDKPVLLKKNIIDKNKAAHPDVKESDYAQIIGQSLYNPDMVVPGHKDKPYFNFVSRVGIDKNTVVLLEVAETKENYEIVNFHWVDNAARIRKQRRGERIEKNK